MTARLAGAGYTVNVDGNIRQMAAEVMHRVLRGLPAMRNAMVLGLAGFISRLSDDFPEVRLSIRQPAFLLPPGAVVSELTALCELTVAVWVHAASALCVCKLPDSDSDMEQQADCRDCRLWNVRCSMQALTSGCGAEHLLFT